MDVRRAVRRSRRSRRSRWSRPARRRPRHTTGEELTTPITAVTAPVTAVTRRSRRSRRRSRRSRRRTRRTRRWHGGPMWGRLRGDCCGYRTAAPVRAKWPRGRLGAWCGVPAGAGNISGVSRRGGLLSPSHTRPSRSQNPDPGETTIPSWLQTGQRLAKERGEGRTKHTRVYQVPTYNPSASNVSRKRPGA